MINEELWAVLEAGNDLRNAIAHGHKEGAIAARTTDLRKAYPVEILRVILMVLLIASFILGLISFLLNRQKRLV